MCNSRILQGGKATGRLLQEIQFLNIVVSDGNRNYEDTRHSRSNVVGMESDELEQKMYVYFRGHQKVQ